jgi:hypothetical protein
MKGVGKAWTGFIWLRIGASGGLLGTQHRTFRFNKMWGISSLAKLFE